MYEVLLRWNGSFSLAVFEKTPLFFRTLGNHKRYYWFYIQEYADGLWCFSVGVFQLIVFVKRGLNKNDIDKGEEILRVIYQRISSFARFEWKKIYFFFPYFSYLSLLFFVSFLSLFFTQFLCYSLEIFSLILYKLFHDHNNEMRLAINRFEKFNLANY